MELRAQRMSAHLSALPELPTRAPLCAPAVLTLRLGQDRDVRQKQAIPNSNAKKLCLKKRSKKIAPRLGKQPRMLARPRLRRSLPPKLAILGRLLPKGQHRALTDVPTEKLLPLERSIPAHELFRNRSELTTLQKGISCAEEIA